MDRPHTSLNSKSQEHAETVLLMPPQRHRTGFHCKAMQNTSKGWKKTLPGWEGWESHPLGCCWLSTSSSPLGILHHSVDSYRTIRLQTVTEQSANSYRTISLQTITEQSVVCRQLRNSQSADSYGTVSLQTVTEQSVCRQLQNSQSTDSYRTVSLQTVTEQSVDRQ